MARRSSNNGNDGCGCFFLVVILVGGISWLWTDHRWAIWALIAVVEILLAVPTVRSVRDWVRYESARRRGGLETAQTTKVLGYFALLVALSGILAIAVFFVHNFVPLRNVIASVPEPSPVWWILSTGTVLLWVYVFYLSEAVARRLLSEQQLRETQERTNYEQTIRAAQEKERRRREQEEARRAEQRREQAKSRRAAEDRSKREQEERRWEQAKRAREGSSAGQQQEGNRWNSSNRGRERGGSTRPKAGHAHEILQVGLDASKEEINAAYRRMVKMYHPDRVSGLAPEYAEIAERKMKEINAAYEQLNPKGGR